ncbi:diaminopropionate ammonia-lyase [Ruegeria pomeroyi]|uniref:Diaminopropionate ammonia-lyase n=2 Tax=Ruegeria pomeroyi TaxID=89184 RepID=Q5LRD3_RUEPO|nr:diaminopropionate ammonia-lyase [Ruegeria pomeroyi]AAV95462.1 diaminopropionate ammonia-lyase [Ruegeria pomeroyi DSS-3]NVK97066.1 diaminopropionate ammonia-lyase [Ruegeria pomeroyi]NVL01959.1 diaminopropionate ammonia-lyase [Ruegeria pomeroyi]QWV09028.1 diaminopropionate ammonia-lyase [Ruegeria pomeroyi]
MKDLLPAAQLGHVACAPTRGDAAHRVLSQQDFDAAEAEITQWEGYAPTPLVSLPALAEAIGVGAILYKHEGPRFGLGSFKALGGAYAALGVLQREIARRTGAQVELADIRAGKHRDAVAGITLVSATDGNHGRSLAWGCQRFGAPCRIYIHAEVSEGRAQAMRDLGAEVIRIDGDYDASVRMAKDEAEAHGWFVVSDTSWPGYSDPPRDVMAGYGVMVREVCREMDRAPTHVFLQGGVGGLAAGVTAALVQHWGEASPRVVVVEPDRAACLYESARAGAATAVEIAEETIMAGLSCGEPSPLAWAILAEEARDYLTIPDTLVAPTVRLLAHPLGGDPVVEAGESAVAGLAALIAACSDAALSDSLGLDRSARVLLIGSEGITDPEIYARIMAGEDMV